MRITREGASIGFESILDQTIKNYTNSLALKGRFEMFKKNFVTSSQLNLEDPNLTVLIGLSSHMDSSLKHILWLFVDEYSRESKPD